MNATTTGVTNKDLMISIEELKGVVGGLQDSVGTLQDSVGVLQESVGGLQDSVGDLQGNMTDLMQMTSEGFDRLDVRMDKLEDRMEGVEGQVTSLGSEVRELKQTSYRHELQLAEVARLAQSTYDEQLNMHADINEMLHRIIALEKRSPQITKAEFEELQKTLQKVVDWAKAVAKKEGIPLKLS